MGPSSLYPDGIHFLRCYDMYVQFCILSFLNIMYTEAVSTIITFSDCLKQITNELSNDAIVSEPWTLTHWVINCHLLFHYQSHTSR